MRAEPNRRRFLQGTAAATAGAALASAVSWPAHANPLVGSRFISDQPGQGRFPLVANATAAPLLVSDDDYPGVRRAVGDLRDDVERVTGVKPVIAGPDDRPAEEVVLIGTIGRSSLIDTLVESGKLTVDGIAGKWETSLQQVVDNPLPGIRRAFVIAGSDQRGTIFGVYEVSKQCGVSPWYWWADVPARQHDALYVLPGRHTQGTPAVRYRGFFINDENPALGRWAPRYFGPGKAEGYPDGFNHLFYAKVFELMLRLKANYLWPAVWGRAFAEDDPENHATASYYGVVMGTSHEAPMLRGIEEWNRHAVPAERDENGNITKPGHDPYGGTGEWSFRYNRKALEAYWADGIKRMVRERIEGVVTVGMRGPGDLELPDGNAIPLMREIIAAERRVLQETTGREPSEFPQIWALYKEVMRYWQQGLRPPDDVTVVIPDDNWGNINMLPAREDRNRSGGFGLYYHFDYVGDGRCYKWVDTNPLPNVWDQLHQAYQYGVDRLWVVNVGDLKASERPLQFFLDYAWDPASLPLSEIPEWDRRFAEQNFGPEHATAISEVLTEYTALQGRRKPELLNRRITLDPNKDPATDEDAVVYDDEASPFSLTDYREIEVVTDEWRRLAERVERIGQQLPERDQAAYYQLVRYRATATANLYQLREAEFTSILYAAQGRATANSRAAETEALFAKDQAMSDYYNHTLSGGKWQGFQTQPKIGYGDKERYGPDAGWQQPQRNNVALPDAVFPLPQRVQLGDEPEMGVAVDGSEAWWPNEQTPAQLPTFSPFQSQPAQYIEVFNRGKGEFDYRIAADQPWVHVTPSQGRVTEQVRAVVRIDWSRVPRGTTRATLTVTGAGRSVDVRAVIDKPRGRRPSTGFVEANGYVSIDAAHFSRAVPTSNAAWKRIPGIGRTGDGMEPFPVTAPRHEPGTGPRLEYELTLVSSGPVKVIACLSPRNDALPQGGPVYAVSFDDQPPQAVDITKVTGADPIFLNRQWERNTSDNVNRTTTEHTIGKPGRHTLKFWMVDPTVVVQKLIVDTGGLRYSYLGPPESRRV